MLSGKKTKGRFSEDSLKRITWLTKKNWKEVLLSVFDSSVLPHNYGGNEGNKCSAKLKDLFRICSDDHHSCELNDHELDECDKHKPSEEHECFEGILDEHEKHDHTGSGGHGHSHEKKH